MATVAEGLACSVSGYCAKLRLSAALYLIFNLKTNIMEVHSNYYIKSKDEPNKVVIVTDQNPTGVTLTLKDENSQVQFSLCRMEMIEALEYVLMKIKARPL